MTYQHISIEGYQDSHHKDCSMTDFGCVECGEELEEDAETCIACKAERYDRSIPTDALIMGLYCFCCCSEL
jgi:hypothetical protein